MALPIIKKFLRILRIELEDLKDDVEQLAQGYQQKLKDRNITEHVCYENIAVLRNEFYGIGHFIEIIEKTDPGSFDDIEALTSHLKSEFEIELQRAGLERAAYVLAERRIDKVKRYIAMVEE